MNIDVVYVAWNRLEFTRYSFGLLLANTDWGLVDRLVVYDDGSTDGTREWLDKAVRSCGVPGARVVYLGHGSPVAVMNDYLDSSIADAFAKVDNDIAVPPGWLGTMVNVLDENPRLDLLGMEAGRTGIPGPPPVWHAVEPASHIGGIGLMRTSAFLDRPAMRARGRFGFTEFQDVQGLRCGWISPDLLVPQLDRVPVEPFASLSREYIKNGWQRRWPAMDDRFSRPYYEWLPPLKED